MSTMYKTERSVENELRAPKMYAVIMHNDDYTPMDFVVDILVRIFHKAAQKASEIMLAVHEKGSGLAGVYTYDVAMTKKSQTELLAKEKGFPLQLSLSETE